MPFLNVTPFSFFDPSSVFDENLRRFGEATRRQPHQMQFVSPPQMRIATTNYANESHLLGNLNVNRPPPPKTKHRRGRSFDFDQEQPKPEMRTGIELASPIHQEASGTLLIDARNQQDVAPPINFPKNSEMSLSYANLTEDECNTNYSSIDSSYMAIQRSVATKKINAILKQNGNSNKCLKVALPVLDSYILLSVLLYVAIQDKHWLFDLNFVNRIKCFSWRSVALHLTSWSLVHFLFLPVERMLPLFSIILPAAD